MQKLEDALPDLAMYECDYPAGVYLTHALDPAKRVGTSYA